MGKIQAFHLLLSLFRNPLVSSRGVRRQLEELGQKHLPALTSYSHLQRLADMLGQDGTWRRKEQKESSNLSFTPLS